MSNQETPDQETTIVALSRRVNDIRERLRKFKPHAVEKMMDTLKADVERQHACLRSMLINSIITSEVHYLLRGSRFQSAVVMELVRRWDTHGDEWW